MRPRSLLLAGIIGAAVGAGVMYVVDLRHPSVQDLRVAALGFEDYLRDARLAVLKRCGDPRSREDNERALSKHAEQEAAFNFAVISMHAYDTPARRDFDRLAQDMNAARAGLNALRCK